ncbi:hypothetical protein BDQ17DRAFT_1385730, partial [Cyathus striatus]
EPVGHGLIGLALWQLNAHSHCERMLWRNVGSHLRAWECNALSVNEDVSGSINQEMQIEKMSLQS